MCLQRCAAEFRSDATSVFGRRGGDVAVVASVTIYPVISVVDRCQADSKRFTHLSLVAGHPTARWQQSP